MHYGKICFIVISENGNVIDGWLCLQFMYINELFLFHFSVTKLIRCHVDSHSLMEQKHKCFNLAINVPVTNLMICLGG